MGAIFKRELKAYFTAPLGYIFVGVVFALSGYYFWYVLSMQYNYIEYVFSSMFTVVTMIVPLLTMRLLSEEKKLKTDQLLFTAPVNLTDVVLGKYFAALVVYLIGISCTLLFQIVLAVYAVPDWNIFLGNFLALFLVGAAFIAIGLFISALTENQIVAAIGTFAVVLLVWMFDMIASVLPAELEFLAVTLNALSFSTRYNDFVSGLLDISHILFFLSFAGAFNFLTVRMLERKRWS